MHGADNSTTGRVPLDLEVVLVGDTLNWESLTAMYVSHALLTWSVVGLVLLIAGTSLYGRRVGHRPATDRTRVSMED
jgi:hypothetical protein